MMSCFSRPLLGTETRLPFSIGVTWARSSRLFGVKGGTPATTRVAGSNESVLDGCKPARRGCAPAWRGRGVACGSSASRPCSIHPARLPMVTGQWEVIATTAPALGSAVGRNVLFSCARSWFSVKGQSQAASAAVLLGARDPRRPAPPLPGLRATAQPGVYSEDGGASGEVLAKRVGHAWLVVQGQSVQLTKALLNTLRVKGQSVQ
jgi:hypothetical protein